MLETCLRALLWPRAFARSLPTSSLFPPFAALCATAISFGLALREPWNGPAKGDDWVLQLLVAMVISFAGLGLSWCILRIATGKADSLWSIAAATMMPVVVLGPASALAEQALTPSVASAASTLAYAAWTTPIVYWGVRRVAPDRTLRATFVWVVFLVGSELWVQLSSA